MSNNHYTDEFKIAVVKQVTEGGYSVADVAKRLEVSQPGIDLHGVLAHDAALCSRRAGVRRPAESCPES